MKPQSVLLIILTAIVIAVAVKTEVTSNNSDGHWKPDSVVAYSRVPKVYRQWWNEISDCAHLRGDMSKIKWFRAIEIVPGPYDADRAFSCPYVKWCDGWWNGAKNPHSIYISYAVVRDKRVVKHEMLHELLGHKNLWGTKHHPLFRQCHVA